MDDRVRVGTKISVVGILINLALAVGKLAAGILGNSAAMISDAINSASDVLVTGVAMFGVWIGHRPSDDDHPYGHRRIETEITRILGLTLIVTGVAIGWSAVNTIRRGPTGTPGLIALWAALATLGIKEGMYRYTVAAGRRIQSSALLASAWDHRSDAISSVAALLGILGARLGFPVADPLAGVAVALLIIFVGGRIYWEATTELVDTLPSPDLPEQVRKVIVEVPGVIDVQDVRGRKHGAEILLDVRLSVSRLATVEQGHAVGHNVKKRLLEEIPNVVDVLVHVNPSEL